MSEVERISRKILSSECLYHVPEATWLELLAELAKHATEASKSDVWLRTNRTAYLLSQANNSQRERYALRLLKICPMLIHGESRIAISHMGILSHVLPFVHNHISSDFASFLLSEVTQKFPVSKLFYPVQGGGACHALNTVNILKFCLLRFEFSKAGALLDDFCEEYRSQKAELFNCSGDKASENLRLRRTKHLVATARYMLHQDKEVLHWVRYGPTQETQSHWNALIWQLAFSKACRKQNGTLEGANHLSCYL